MAPIRRVRHACTYEGCDVTCSRKKDVERHERDVHEKDAQRRYACPACGKTMSQKSNMVIHMRRVCYIEDESPIDTRPLASKPAKLPSRMARVVEADRVDSVLSIQECFNVFSVTDSHDSTYKVEEQSYLLDIDNIPTTPDALPPLTPSYSVSDSMSPPSWEYLACSDSGYTLPTTSLSASSSLDYYDTISQSISASYPSCNMMGPEVFCTPSLDINIAYPDLLPTTAFQDIYAPQYWNTAPPMFIPACGLINPLAFMQPELQNNAEFDSSFTDPSLYFSTELSYGTNMPDESLQYQTFTADDPSVYSNTNGLIYDDLYVQPANPTDYPNVDFSYFDPSWNILATPDNFDGLSF